MKGDIAMKKLDLIYSEYIHEAEIPEDMDMIVTEKQGFFRKFSYFMNSPVGVAMLCAVVSLSVLFVVVMAGRNGLDEPQNPPTPAGSLIEQESPQTNDETRAQTDHETETTQDTSAPVETETDPTGNPPELVPTYFASYMDGYGFVGDLSEGDFIHGVLGKFSYEGQPLNEMPILSGSGELWLEGGFHGTALYDGEHTGFTFAHESISPTYGDSSYLCHLQTRVDLEGFALPYGVAFGDAFDDVMVKMALTEHTEYKPGETVLYRIGNETLTLQWNVDYVYNTYLVFEEIQTSDSTDNRSMTVTRKLTLAFGDDLTLAQADVKIETVYRAQATDNTDPDIGELPTSVADEIKAAYFKENVTEDMRQYYTVDDLSLRYFGTYNGGYVVFVDGIFDYTTAFEYETVLGIEFEYSSGQKLLYYKDGCFYSLTDAASRGLLNQADIQTLHAVYSN